MFRVDPNYMNKKTKKDAKAISLLNRHLAEAERLLRLEPSLQAAGYSPFPVESGPAE